MKATQCSSAIEGTARSQYGPLGIALEFRPALQRVQWIVPMCWSLVTIQQNVSDLPPAILLTGRPGAGNPTLILRVVSRLEGAAGGFCTREIRAHGRRIGLELVTLASETACLATAETGVSFERGKRFGRYRVNLDALDAVGVPALHEA